jgi:hypothetical protein
MRANRKSVLPRLEMVSAMGFPLVPYGPYAERVREALAGRGDDD